MGQIADYNILFLFALILYPFFEGFKDGNTHSINAKRYHVAGWLTRAMVAVCLVPEWYWLPLYAAYFWFTFDAAWNFTASVPILYVGSTFWLDKKLGRKIIWVKIFFLILSIVLLIGKLSL